MIINRYILFNIFQGVMLALLVLVSLSLFFVFISQMDDLGRGQYGLSQAFYYVLLKLPGKAVEFMPLAVLIGTMLSMGTLAANSELIVLQCSGFGSVQLLLSVLKAAGLIAIFTFLLSEWLVPTSETLAKQLRRSSFTSTPVKNIKKGLWIKDEQNIIFIKRLLPNGQAQFIEVYEFDDQQHLLSSFTAEKALPENQQWLLFNVQKSIFHENSISSEFHQQLKYQGNISIDVLDSLMIQPLRMSVTNLYSYMQFLQNNNRDSSVESLTFWQKVYAPLSIIVLGILALPFVLGSQRENNAGRRIMIGILIGLSFVVLDKLMIQVGVQINLWPALNALLPTMLALTLALMLLWRKQQQN